MPQNDDLKARLMAEAETAIERMMQEREGQDQLTITEIERLAQRVGEQMMQSISQELVSEESQPEEGRSCPRCGQRMRYKGEKGRNVISKTGTLRVERAYYYCEACGEGVFPPR